MSKWLLIYKKIIYVNCGLRNEYESDHCSNKHYLLSLEVVLIMEKIAFIFIIHEYCFTLVCSVK